MVFNSEFGIEFHAIFGFRIFDLRFSEPHSSAGSQQPPKKLDRSLGLSPPAANASTPESGSLRHPLGRPHPTMPRTDVKKQRRKRSASSLSPAAADAVKRRLASPPDRTPESHHVSPTDDDSVEAYCRGCDWNLPATAAVWGTDAITELRNGSTPHPQISGLFVNATPRHQCSGCRSGHGSAHNQPIIGPASTPVLDRLSDLERRLTSPPPPTVDPNIRRLAEAMEASQAAPSKVTLDGTNLVTAFARAQPLPVVHRAPQLSREDARSVRHVALWSARYVRCASGLTPQSRLAASAFAFGLANDLRDVVLSTLTVSGRSTSDLDSMDMAGLRSLVREAVPVPNESVQVSAWFRSIRCSGASESAVDDYVLEYRTFFESHPVYAPPAELNTAAVHAHTELNRLDAAAVHARAELNRMFVLGLCKSPLKEKLMGAPEKWESDNWLDLLQHVSGVRKKISGKSCDEITRRPVKLQTLSAEPLTEVPSDDYVTPGTLTKSDHPVEDEPWLTGSDAEQAQLFRLAASRGRRHSPDDARRRNCVFCLDATSKHTFASCNLVQRLLADQPNRPLCQPCWQAGHWFFRNHLEKNCTARPGSARRDGASSNRRDPAAGPTPRFSVPVSSLHHLSAEVPPLPADAPAAATQIRERLLAIQSQLTIDGPPPPNPASK